MLVFGVACAKAAEPLADAVVFATDDPRVFELRLPESVAPPEGLPQVRLTNYLCAESGSCKSGCSVCNRPTQEKWSASIDYLLFDADHAYAYSGSGVTGNDSANGLRVQLGREADDGLGWRVRYEWFGDERRLNEPSFGRSVDESFSAQRLSFDLFQRFAVGKTEFRLGIGPTAAMIRETSIYSSRTQQLDGIGAGTFIDFRREFGRIGQTDFAVVGGASYDYLYVGDNASSYYKSIGIRQLNLGVEARREFDRGSLILRTAYEQQSWSYLSLLHGVSFRLGYTW